VFDYGVTTYRNINVQILSSGVQVDRMSKIVISDYQNNESSFLVREEENKPYRACVQLIVCVANAKSRVK